MSQVKSFMINKSMYRKIFPNVKGVLGYVSLPGTVGDQLADFATFSLLNLWKIPFEVISLSQLEKYDLAAHIQHLLIPAGSRIGDSIPENVNARLLASQQGLPVTVLPQSILDGEAIDGYQTIWVRERRSLEKFQNTKLAPDITMYLKLDNRLNEICKSSALYLNDDGISVQRYDSLNMGDPEKISSNLAAYLDLIAPYRLIVTDRLQFAISAMLMQREVILLADKHEINKAMWETWLKARGCKWADDMNGISNISKTRLHKMVNPSEKFYLKGNDKLQRIQGWRLRQLKGRCKIVNKHVGETIYIDEFERFLWKELRHKISYACLVSRLKPRFKTTNELNLFLDQSLRFFFDKSLIVIHYDSDDDSADGRIELSTPVNGPVEVTVFKPVRIENDSFVFADVLVESKIRSIWFRVDRNYKNWLDSFGSCMLLSLFQLAMMNNKVLWIKNIKVSRSLLRNIKQLQSVWVLWHKNFSKVDICCRIDNETSNQTTSRKQALACFSGGVDSSFTLFHHSRDTENRYKENLTHVLLVHGFDMPISDYASFQQVEKKSKMVVDDVKVKLITLATNIRETVKDWQVCHGACTAAVLHLFAGKFNCGLIPSTLNYGILYPWGSTHLTDPMLSSNVLAIKSDGAEFTRTDKVYMMRDWRVGLKNLRFCWSSYPAVKNCGQCAKCLTTAIILIITNVNKSSISPFPSDRQLQNFINDSELSRLDKSDLRNINNYVEMLKEKPGWLNVLTIKLKAQT